jgi:hypothetical protein
VPVKQISHNKFLTTFARNLHVIASPQFASRPTKHARKFHVPPSQRQQPRIIKIFCCVYNFSLHVGRKYLCQSPNCINQIYSTFTIGYIWTQKDLVRAPNGEIENNANVCHKTSNCRFLDVRSDSMTNFNSNPQPQRDSGLSSRKIPTNQFLALKLLLMLLFLWY